LLADFVDARQPKAGRCPRDLTARDDHLCASHRQQSSTVVVDIQHLEIAAAAEMGVEVAQRRLRVIEFPEHVDRRDDLGQLIVVDISQARPLRLRISSASP